MAHIRLIKAYEEIIIFGYIPATRVPAVSDFIGKTESADSQRW